MSIPGFIQHSTTLNYLHLNDSNDEISVVSEGNNAVNIKVDTNNNNLIWKFGTDAKLSLPVNGDIVDSNGDSVLGQLSLGNLTVTSSTITSSDGVITLRTGDQAHTYSTLNQSDTFIEMFSENDVDGANSAWAWINASLDNGHESPEVHIEVQGSTTGTTQRWTFDSNGVVTNPGNIKQKTDGTITCLPNVDTVIYTASDSLTSTIKALFHVEGTEQGTLGYDAHSCEMIVSSIGGKVSGSVYGLAYTSIGPLATFNARWNSATNKVEITCRPTSTDNQVIVTATATEMLTTL
jgi:hypothetical protein